MSVIAEGVTGASVHLDIPRRNEAIMWLYPMVSLPSLPPAEAHATVSKGREPLADGEQRAQRARPDEPGLLLIQL